MATLDCYLDESFKDEFFVVAGYMGWDAVWDRSFAPAWREVLAKAPRPLRQFAAADCRHARREFEGWDKDKECRPLVTDLVSVAASHDLVGFASVLILSGVPAPDQDQLRQKREAIEKGAYGVAVGRALWLIARYWPDFPQVEAVRVILDRKDGFYSRAKEQHERIRAQIRIPADAAKFEPLSPGESEHLTPLQAADLLAYEVYKECVNRLDGRPVSKALERLATAAPIFTSVMAFPDWRVHESVRITEGPKAAGALTAKKYTLWQPRGPIRSAESWPYDGMLEGLRNMIRKQSE